MGRCLGRCLVAGVLVWSNASWVEAADVWVDGDASSCPANGDETDPYPTLQCAFDNAELVAGDRILVDDAATTYGGATLTTQASGTVAMPIVIEPAPGAGPRFSGGLALGGVNYWTVRGLVFEGGSGDALALRGGEGLAARDVEILDWAGRGIVVGTPSSLAPGAAVHGNRVQRVERHGIYIENADGAVVANNEISEVQCFLSAFTLCTECGAEQCFACGDCLDALEPVCTATEDFELGDRVGIRVLGDSNSVEITRNFIHDFESESCAVDRTRNVAVFITGSGVRQGSVDHNWIRGIAPDADGYGVLMLQSAPGWTVERNLIDEVGTCGLCEGDFLFYGGVGTRWLHNTVVRSAYGIDVRSATDAVFARNLVSEAATAGVRVQPDGTAANLTFVANVYDAPDVGVWGQQAGDLDAWQGACDCDLDAREGEPGFGGEGDYTPAPDGIAADLPGEEGPFHGVGPDAGAFESVLAISAVVTAAEPAQLVVELDNRVAPPLRGLEACAGISVEVDGSRAALAGCSLLGDERMVVSLVDAVSQGEQVQFRHVGGPATDSSRIGGRIGARLADVTLNVANEAPPAEPDDTGTSGSTGDATQAESGSAAEAESGDATASGVGDDTGGQGCACRFRASSRGTRFDGLAPMLLLLLGALRRRDRSW